MHFTIPATIDGAAADLSELNKLLTAKGWQRAALVYAFTNEPASGRPRKTTGKPGVSCAEFAKLGIRGLVGADEVARYRKVWADLPAETRDQAVPGAVLDLDKLKLPGWKPLRPRKGLTQFETSAKVETKAAKIREAIEADPKLADAVADLPAVRTAARERDLTRVNPDRLTNPADIKANSAALRDTFEPFRKALRALGIGAGIENAVDAINKFAEDLREATMTPEVHAEALELVAMVQAATDNLQLAVMELHMNSEG